MPTTLRVPGRTGDVITFYPSYLLANEYNWQRGDIIGLVKVEVDGKKEWRNIMMNDVGDSSLYAVDNADYRKSSLTLEINRVEASQGSCPVKMYKNSSSTEENIRVTNIILKYDGSLGHITPE